jgi:branched-chain amino acid transport system substrate-binding protein
MNSKTTLRTILAALAACVGTLGMSGAFAQAATGEPIRIGAIFAMTGPIGPQGQAQRRGAELALKAINEAGGIGGRPLEFVFEDDAFNPDSAMSKANQLIHSRKVAGLITHGTASSAAVGGITQPMSLPLITISGLNPAVEADRKCVFHMFAPQDLNARALLAYAKAQRFRKVALLHDSGYGAVLAAQMMPLLAQYEIELVANEKFEAAANDATAQAAKVKAANPEAYFVVAANPAPFRNLRQLRASQPIIAAIGSSTYEFVKAMGPGADDVVFADFVVGEDPLAFQKAFVERYRKEFNSLPKNFEAAGWDLANIYAAALKKAGAGATPAQLCEAIRSQPYSGVLVERRDFSARDMTGIRLSNFVYSKVTGGVYSRTTFRAQD